MRRAMVLTALAGLAIAPLALARTGSRVRTDPRDVRGKLDLQSVAVPQVGPLLTVTIRMYGPWRSRILEGRSGTAGPTAGRDRLVVLYDTNGDGRADYRGRIVFWKGRLAEWITGRGSALEPVAVQRPDGGSLSFAHPVNVLFAGQTAKKTLRLAVESVYRQGTYTPACRDRLPDRGWVALPLPRRQAVNLVATAAVKNALRTAFLRAHRRYAPKRVEGPLRGTTYYGRYGRTKYAFATFSIPRLGTQDQPELFERLPGRAWRDLGDTGGEICARDVPLALIEVWHLRHAGPGCYVPG